MKEFADKAVIVTGGSRGIGAEIARAFAAVGARVAIVYRSGKEAAENLCSEIAAAGGDAVAVQADISKPLDAKQAVEKAAKQFSKIDILINAAGIGPYLPLAGMVDLDAERRRLEKELANIDGQLQRINGLLNNPGFVGKAPAEVVERERAKQDELTQQRDQLASHMRELV